MKNVHVCTCAQQSANARGAMYMDVAMYYMYVHVHGLLVQYMHVCLCQGIEKTTSVYIKLRNEILLPYYSIVYCV